MTALLRNSMKPRISERKFKHHVPGQWEKAIKIQKARSKYRISIGIGTIFIFF